ncbi:MAG: ABC transporter permease subunit [Candidatus Eisenbacteria bacterium]|uniref:ABC transporter permease subunit n=1 Tax=Eiseniibacteriota bacterium TaxID=2212470 RepID=A0A7Y2EC58_UNCEI|nr:ABC transporter permease subunit [Candidatus Eisenbacteria bacterium]
MSAVSLALLVVWAWAYGGFRFTDLFQNQSRENATRFLREIRPFPLQDQPWDWTTWFRWMSETIGPNASEALGATLALSVAAVILAAMAALVVSVFAARNLAGPEPFAPSGKPPSQIARVLHRGLVGVTRLILLFARSIPEYVWAFLFITMLGVGAWPVVLALAVHNAGILGRLFSEVIENVEPSASRTLRVSGAGRGQLFVHAILPQSLNRWLLYFFYRWETCIREATVLGLLGFISLGWYIQDARAGVRYDEMVVYVGLGAILILLADLVSAVARRYLRSG